jgi:hypothetical protein
MADGYGAVADDDWQDKQKNSERNMLEPHFVYHESRLK